MGCHSSDYVNAHIYILYTYMHTYVCTHTQLYLASMQTDSPAGPEEAISYNAHCTRKGLRGWEAWAASRS